MPKILNLWESDTSKLPIDPNERAALWGKQLEAINGVYFLVVEDLELPQQMQRCVEKHNAIYTMC